MVDKFHDYFYGAKYYVQTDNNPLTYVLTTAKLNATGHMWLADLSTCEFDIQYRLSNIDTDLLSRQNRSEEKHRDWETIPPAGYSSSVVKQVFQALQRRPQDTLNSWVLYLNLSQTLLMLFQHA